MSSRNLLFAGAAAVVLSAGAASAQDQGTEIEEVVVTARKIEENVQDIPVAVTALSGANLERKNFREIRDLASLAPSLNFGQGGSTPAAANPSLRGQTQPDNVLTTDAAVALYVDNVVLPRSYGLRAQMIDVARIEVLRGPQGTLYGKNTTGGLINVITNDPGPDFGASLKGSWGNYDAWNFVGILNVPINENMSFRLVGQRGHHDGYGRDGAGRELGYEESSFVRGKFKGEWGPLTVRVFADYMSFGDSGIYRIAGLTPATATLPEGGRLTQEAAVELFGSASAANVAAALPVVRSYITDDYYRTFGTFEARDDNYARDAGLDISYAVTDDITLRSITGYRSLAFAYPSDLDGTPFIGTHPRRAAQDDYISQELQLLGGDADFNWVVGGFANWEHGKEYSTTASLLRFAAPTRPDQRNLTNGKVTGESYAVFGQANWRFAPAWSATVGARYTTDKRGLISQNQVYANGGLFSCSVPVDIRPDPAICLGTRSDTFKEPTWTASLTYQPNDDVTTYAKASHGFRSGGQNYRGAVSVESFQPFKPETVNEYEIGLKTELFDRTLRINVAAYYDKISDVQRSIIIAVPSTGQTATVQTNAASATVKGIELEGAWRVTRGFTIDAAFSAIDPKYKEFRDFNGDRSGEDWPTPKTQWSVGANYSVLTSVGDLTATVAYQAQSRKNLSPAAKQSDQVTQKGYGLLNARLSLDLLDQDVTVAVFGRNLADKEYLVGAVALESIGWNTVVTGEPRVYGIELTKRFGRP